MPDHDPTRADGAAELMRKAEARKAARVEAILVVERWNRPLEVLRVFLFVVPLRWMSEGFLGFDSPRLRRKFLL
jgi:hypothetical protein